MLLSIYLFIYFRDNIHILFYLFIYLFLAVLGLRFCARALSSCGKRGPLFIAVRRPLTITASIVAEHRLQMRRLSNCGSRAQLLRGMWDPPRPGLEPVSPALAGRLSTTAPPGKPILLFLFLLWLPWLGLPKLCWIIVVRVDILVLFLILEEMLSGFHHWEWCLLWVCPIWPLLCWGRFPLCPLSGEFLS